MFPVEIWFNVFEYVDIKSLASISMCSFHMYHYIKSYSGAEHLWSSKKIIDKIYNHNRMSFYLHSKIAYENDIIGFKHIVKNWSVRDLCIKYNFIGAIMIYPYYFNGNYKYGSFMASLNCENLHLMEHFYDKTMFTGITIKHFYGKKEKTLRLLIKLQDYTLYLLSLLAMQTSDTFITSILLSYL